MLKLMKYEFRKMRAVLVVMLLALAGLELGFIGGTRLDKPYVTAVSLGLLTMLVFAAYVYILIAGIVSYSRELKDRTGYLVFMTPTRPISVVLSKLLFTILAALAATAVFALAAWMDYSWLVRRMDIDPLALDKLDMALRFAFGNVRFGLNQIKLLAVYSALAVLIEIMLSMCAAYLAITLSATLLQNRKGFLRSLISFALFAALSWGSGWITNRLCYQHLGFISSAGQITSIIGWSLLLNLALCAAFAWLSAFLLDRKVNL